MSIANFYVRIRLNRLGLPEFNVKFNLSPVRVAYKTCIAVLQKPHEIRICRMHAHRHAPDFDDEVESVHFCQ